MDITLSKSRLWPLLFGIMGLVVLAGVAVEVGKPGLGLSSDSGLLPLFSLSYEGNIPTVYTAAVIFTCALLLALTAAGTQKRGRFLSVPWWILAAGFLCMSLDEMLSFHESADALVDLNHIFYFDWVVPASIFVLLVGALFIPFLRRLPPRTRYQFIIAGAIYVFGAVGMDVPLGYWSRLHGTHNLGYALIDALEESMEMLGLNLFLLALIDHLAGEAFSLRFSRGDEAKP